MKQVMMISMGQKELLYGMGDILVNNPRVTLAFLHFMEFPLSMMTNQLAPVIFSLS